MKSPGLESLVCAERLFPLAAFACSQPTVPFLFVLYVVSYLDRVNVAFAALEINRDLGLSPAAYSFGAGIFLIGYSLFEVPSNLILARTGARTPRSTWLPLKKNDGGGADGSLLWVMITLCMAGTDAAAGLAALTGRRPSGPRYRSD
jgi:hypothetical protein